MKSQTQYILILIEIEDQQHHTTIGMMVFDSARDMDEFVTNNPCGPDQLYMSRISRDLKELI